MPGLFSQNNVLLCGMQGNNGLLPRTFKKFPESPIRPAGSYFWQVPNAKFAVRVADRLNNLIKNALLLFFI